MPVPNFAPMVRHEYVKHLPLRHIADIMHFVLNAPVRATASGLGKLP